jgi:hypothetical protein
LFAATTIIKAASEGFELRKPVDDYFIKAKFFTRVLSLVIGNYTSFQGFPFYTNQSVCKRFIFEYFRKHFLSGNRYFNIIIFLIASDNQVFQKLTFLSVKTRENLEILKNLIVTFYIFFLNYLS